MKYNLPPRVKREIIALAKDHDIRKVILFGSRARNTNTERSDIVSPYMGEILMAFISMPWKK